MKKEDKIIMYDSDEAAQIKTLTGWVGGKHYWGADEHMARWDGCTHIKCECGHIHEKQWTKCPMCQKKERKERYDKLPYKEWNLIEPVVEWDGDTYFFDIDSLHDYMDEHEIEVVDLLFCDPIYYSPINMDSIADDVHEDWEPSEELCQKVAELNKYLQSLPAHSYMPGKTRTTYKVNKEQGVQVSDTTEDK